MPVNGERARDTWEIITHAAYGSDNPSSELKQECHNRWGQRAVRDLNGCAEASNIGIVVQAIGGWFPAFAAFAAVTPLGYLMLIGDPAIYLLRALIRVTKLIGRRFFGIQFAEDIHGGKPHPGQTAGNLLALGFFILAIVLFSGALVAPPIGITLAWTAGLLGQSCVCYFDYFLPEKRASQNLRLLKLHGATKHTLRNAEKEYAHARRSRQLLMGVLFGLSVLLICGSAVAFAPDSLALVLTWASNAASLGLTTVAVLRFSNMCKESYRKRTQELALVRGCKWVLKICKRSLKRGEEPARQNELSAVQTQDEKAIDQAIQLAHEEKRDIIRFNPQDMKRRNKFKRAHYEKGPDSKKEDIGMGTVHFEEKRYPELKQKPLPQSCRLPYPVVPHPSSRESKASVATQSVDYNVAKNAPLNDNFAPPSDEEEKSNSSTEAYLTPLSGKESGSRSPSPAQSGYFSPMSRQSSQKRDFADPLINPDFELKAS